MQAYLTIHILAYFQNDWKYLVVVEKYQKNENFLTPALKKKQKIKTLLVISNLKCSLENFATVIGIA